MTTVLAVVGASVAGESAWDAAQLQRIVDLSPPGTPASQRISVMDFWEECAHGILGPVDVRSATVTLPAEHQHWGAVAGGDRSSMTGLVTALATQTASFAGADLLLVVGTKAATRAFATTVRHGDRDLQAAYVDQVATPNTTIAHEVGHLFGLQHPWGLFTPADGGVISPEYGSPTCIMGMAYRDPKVCIPLPAVVGGPPAASATGTPTPYYSRGGPRLSCAELVAATLRAGEQPDRRWPVETMPVRGGLSLILTDRPGGPGAFPAVVRFPDTQDLLILELRSGRAWGGVAWDGRLRLDPTDRDVLDSPAVVVHRIQTIPAAHTTGRGDLPLRAWFLGAITVPARLDADLHVTGSTDAMVGLLAYDADSCTAHVRVTHQVDVLPPTCRVQLTDSPDGPATRGPAGPILVDDLGPTCSESGTYDAEWVHQDHVLRATAKTTGLDGVDRVEWRIGGVRIGWSNLGDPPTTTTVTLPDLQLEVPTGYRRWAWERHPLTVTARMTWDQLEVRVPGGLGRLPLQLTAHIRSTDGSASATGWARVTLDARRLSFASWALRSRRAECDTHRARLAAVWLDAARRYPDLLHGAMIKGEVRIPATDWGDAEWDRLQEQLRLTRHLPDDVGSLVGVRDARPGPGVALRSTLRPKLP
ncbi:hypothetical protein [Phycicoccus sp. DTK01]|uniref:hypothetical protein n=1 Tax=Phycicoccus sp. DTK01 TaxID=2785745 RepID=UPI001A8D6B27|nr:hypothetical protein [Phycicoccus sp. DTK01]GIL37561.1 hypothetical protein PDTK01_36360 [Phycicoccus sp. DTK01]